MSVFFGLSEQNILLIGLLALVIWIVMLSIIISRANETKRRDEIQLQNQHLLGLMAEKLGVDIEKINNTLYKNK